MQVKQNNLARGCIWCFGLSAEEERIDLGANGRPGSRIWGVQLR